MVLLWWLTDQHVEAAICIGSDVAEHIFTAHFDALAVVLQDAILPLEISRQHDEHVLT